MNLLTPHPLVSLYSSGLGKGATLCLLHNSGNIKQRRTTSVFAHVGLLRHWNIGLTTAAPQWIKQQLKLQPNGVWLNYKAVRTGKKWLLTLKCITPLQCNMKASPQFGRLCDASLVFHCWHKRTKFWSQGRSCTAFTVINCCLYCELLLSLQQKPHCTSVRAETSKWWKYLFK